MRRPEPNIEPWSGLLASRDCRREPVPFLPGTAPTEYCALDTLFDPEPEISDSLAVADSSQTSELE